MSALFPEIPVFNELLSSITLDAPENVEDWNSTSLVLARARHADGRLEESQEIVIWFRSRSGLTWKALQKKLGESLGQIDHPATPIVCDAVLGLFVLTADLRNLSGITTLNEILGLVVQADLTQYFAFLIEGNLTVEYKVDDFWVGPLDIGQLTYRCRKADSNYAKLFADQLKNFPLSISRLSKVSVIGWERFLSKFWPPFHFAPDDLRYLVIDQYYHVMAEFYFEKFFVEFKEAQLMPQALGASYLSVPALEKLAATERVSIFLNIKEQKSGWVSPSTLGVDINLGGPHVGVPFVRKVLLENYGELQGSALDETLKTYSKFLAEARELEIQQNDSDAFLYHVIALDLLLGEKGSSTASVTKRSALLAHPGLNDTYQDTLSKCNRIYDVRSKYVHQGITPDNALLADVQVICREIAISLLRLKKGVDCENVDFRDSWVKRIDVLVAKMTAEDPIADSEFERVGAASGDDFTYLDLMDGLSGGSGDGEAQ